MSDDAKCETTADCPNEAVTRLRARSICQDCLANYFIVNKHASKGIAYALRDCADRLVEYDCSPRGPLSPRTVERLFALRCAISEIATAVEGELKKAKLWP